MRVEIVVASGNFRRWHERLRERLSRLAPDLAVTFRFVEAGDAYPSAIAQLLTLERMLLRRSRPTLLDRADARDADQSAGAAPDIVIDLTGAESAARAPDGARRLRPLYDGAASEAAAAAELLAGACPSIALEEPASGAIVATGLPSLEAADGLTGGLEAVLSRVVTLVEQAILSPRHTYEKPSAANAVRAPRGPAAFFLRALAFNCARAIYHLCCYSPHWRIGWRFVDGPGVMETGALSGVRWNVLQDRATHFAADPFPIEWRGQTCVFFESLDYRTDKGTIFAQRFDANGPVGEPFLVLEEPWHLSYPCLIERQGELYMLPEASHSGAVTLYRCVDFPGKWERVGQLLTGLEAADATIFKHAGRFWMMSVVREGVGGYSDTLAIHHAPDLFGPWEEHALRPALVDSRLARPAGAVVEMNGALFRPVQDCSTGYGKKLALARIDVLDAENFSQTLTSLILPGPHWPGARLHTLNRWGRLECIDGAIFTPKNMMLRRMSDACFDRRG
jgi:hypothetical protein